MSARLDELPLMEPGDRAAWRAWLAENHGDSTGVWLAVGKKGNNVTSLTYEQAVEEALCFGWIDSVVRRLDDDRFRQLFTPRKPTSIWARSNKQRVERLIAAGLMTDAGLAAIERAKENGSWTTLDDVEALVVPTDLAVALCDVPGAAEGFESLNESSRKMALYWIAEAKRPETRASRIAQTVTAAAEGKAPR